MKASTNSFSLRRHLKSDQSIEKAWEYSLKGKKPTKKKTVKVILDSNALFVPIQFKIDIFRELESLLKRNYEVLLLSPVKRELEAIAREASPKLRKNASLALRLAEKCKYVAVDDKISTNVDDVILKIAKTWNSPVFTNDRQLRKKLRAISVPVIYVRQKSRLEIDGMIG
jgi:rRNA-processing protein FCF1